MDKLPEGFTVDTIEFSDGSTDWAIIPPLDVTIFSVPGEPFLLSAATEEEATIEALDYLKSAGLA